MAVHQFLQSERVVTRARVLERFQRDEPACVRSILADLVSSGLAYRTGRGDSTVFRVAEPEDLAAVLSRDAEASHDAMIWVHVYRQGPISAAELETRVRLDSAQVQASLARLASDGRIRAELDASGQELYAAVQCLIPLGATAGWEAAVFDHYRALVSALMAKLRLGVQSSASADEVGGSTYTFDLWPGHPDEARVRGVLADTRRRMGEIWNDVSSHNARHPTAHDGAYQVTFYCGQYVQEDVRATEQD